MKYVFVNVIMIFIVEYCDIEIVLYVYLLCFVI